MSLKAGVTGMNFHGGPRGVYPAIAFDEHGALEVRPLYYGLLAFAELTANHSKWLPSTESTSRPHPGADPTCKTVRKGCVVHLAVYVGSLRKISKGRMSYKYVPASPLEPVPRPLIGRDKNQTDSISLFRNEILFLIRPPESFSSDHV